MNVRTIKGIFQGFLALYSTSGVRGIKLKTEKSIKYLFADWFVFEGMNDVLKMRKEITVLYKNDWDWGVIE